MLLHVDKLILKAKNLLPYFLSWKTASDDDDLDGAEGDGFSATGADLDSLLREEVQRTAKLFLDTNCDIVLNGSERTNFQIDRRLLIFGGLKIKNIALLDAWEAVGVKEKRRIGKSGGMKIHGFFSK